MKWLFLLFALLIIPIQVYGAGVAINEVLFNPVGNDTGLESIEIYNPDDSSHDLSGWQLYPDGIGYFYFPNHFLLDSRKMAVIHMRSSGVDTATDLYFSGASGNMGNTSGSAALFSGEPRGKDTLKSFVQWGRAGETWEGDAEKAGLWTKGEFTNTADLIEGGTIGLISDGLGFGKIAWKIFASSTIGFFNSNSAVEPTVNLTPASNPQLSASSANWQNYVIPLSVLQLPRIKAYAGEDKNVIAGSVTEFLASAFGLKDEPMSDARFWWNFGDGETGEGKSITHIFKIPGRYTVGIHVSSGEYASSDYLIVEVVPNQMRLKSVLGGEEGYVSLDNPSFLDIDIGEWILEDGAGKRFYLPAKTRIAGKSEVSLANRLTGLFLQKKMYPAVFRYANLDIAYELKEPANLANIRNNSVATVSISNTAMYSSSQNPKETQNVANLSNIVMREEKINNSATNTYQNSNLAEIADSNTASFFSTRKFFIIAAVVLSFISAATYFVFKKAPNV